MSKEEEPVKTFGDFTERSWLVIMLFVDILKSIYDDFVELWRQIDLSWIDAEDEARRRKEEDLTLHPAA